MSPQRRTWHKASRRIKPTHLAASPQPHFKPSLGTDNDTCPYEVAMGDNDGDEKGQRHDFLLYPRVLLG
ncbi:unnamed protein product [Nippostrongylus brasiliensis]|uniref:Uncharacterized protein n=1 Tax=Nippostrongylus brasiliensis TaxID=27835 RepID=A0A0N4XQ31_NIPBR|nr:unnamed protein product [Nippostrongylus brasiliensis]